MILAPIQVSNYSLVAMYVCKHLLTAYYKHLLGKCTRLHHSPPRYFLILSFLLLVERPALAVRLDLCFRSVYFYFFYPGISSEPLNLSQQKFARWRQLVRNRSWWVWIFEFLRGVRLGAKKVTFCPDLPGVTFTKYNMAPKRRKISKIENYLVLAR